MQKQQELAILQGMVQKGKQRGKRLGFPTANIELDQVVPEGIYIATTGFEGKHYPSAVFIGASRTFDETETRAESFLLDFDQELYGKSITIHLLQKIRGNRKFDSPESLIAQMQADVAEVRKFFSSKE